jgi:hypothetical protein
MHELRAETIPNCPRTFRRFMFLKKRNIISSRTLRTNRLLCQSRVSQSKKGGDIMQIVPDRDFDSPDELDPDELIWAQSWPELFDRDESAAEYDAACRAEFGGIDVA